jgi:hypothetical protein
VTQNPTRPKTWLDFLGDEDLSFVKRFVLASGSLKKPAAKQPHGFRRNPMRGVDPTHARDRTPGRRYLGAVR